MSLHLQGYIIATAFTELLLCDRITDGHPDRQTDRDYHHVIPRVEERGSVASPRRGTQSGPLNQSLHSHREAGGLGLEEAEKRKGAGHKRALCGRVLTTAQEC